MAKTKLCSPKNPKAAGGKTVASNPSRTLRRSPRKAAQSGKCTESESVIASSRIAKRTSSTKKAAREKVPNSATKTTKASKPQAADHGMAANGTAAPSCSKSTTTITPKRGRPRKKVSVGIPGSKASKTGCTRKSVDRSEDDKLACTISKASEPKRGWTDSPKKKRLSKSPTKFMCDGSSSINQLQENNDETYDARARQASLGGIRKSIEGSASARNTRSMRRSKSPIRASSQDPARSPGPIARTFAAARTPSMESSRRASKDRSRSPAKATAQVQALGLSCSPPRENSKQGSRARSKSLVKFNGPTCTLETRSAAPRLVRNRISKPKKLRQAATKVRRDPEEKGSKRDMASSRSPSSGLSENQIYISKTRSLRSPAKNSSYSSIYSRQGSPVRPSTELGDSDYPGIQSPDPSPALLKKPAQAVHSSSRPSSGELAFVNRFVGKDEYGRALRRVESQAYRSAKKGERISGQDPIVSMEDGRRAQERGIQRAELEMGLNSIASNKQQHKGSPDRFIRLLSAQRLLSDEPQPSVPKKREGQPTSQDQKGNGEEIPTRRSSYPVRQSSSPRKPPKSSSPAKKLTQTTLPELRQADVVSGSKQLLGQGEPSAPNRGSVHSVTNPELIPGTQKKNPFFETMPAPEVWHRQMPRYFPFGETPFMRRVMSAEISEDLAKGQEQKSAEKNASENLFGRATTAIKSGLSAVGQSIWGSPSKESPSSPPWKLPNVTDSEVEEARRDMQAMLRNAVIATTGQKRKVSTANGPAKRVRRRTSGYHMSGAL